METSTPVINTLLLNNSIHFGMRAGAEEHRNLKLGDVALKLDEEQKIKIHVSYEAQ